MGRAIIASWAEMSHVVVERCRAIAEIFACPVLLVHSVNSNAFRLPPSRVSDHHHCGIVEAIRGSPGCCHRIG